VNHVCHNCSHSALEFLFLAPAFDSCLNPNLSELGLARCRSCRIVNTTGADSDEVARAYTREYYGSGSRKFLPLIDRGVSLANRLQAGRILQAWRQQQSTVKAPSVLDIGCGRGNLLQALQLKGASVLGLEREEFPGHERPGDFVRVGSLSDPEYAGRRFDIIILQHVLEHLEQPEKVLDHITEHLSEKGLLIIAVPNYSSVQQRLFAKYWFHLDLPRHLVHFESQWLLQRLSDRGYAIVSVDYTDWLQNIYGFIQSALNVIAPRQLNHFYSLLKYGRSRSGNTFIPMLIWSLLSMLLLPLALMESILGAVLHMGATVQIVATRGAIND
jgi:SAM-dependent methyltransferase